MFKFELNKGRGLFYLAGLAVIITSVLTVSISGTMAKYARQSEDKKTIVAKEFYFESDLLKDPEENAVVVLNSTATEVSFELRNHADNLRYTKDKIKYVVTVEVLEEKEGTPQLAPSSSGEISGAPSDGEGKAAVTLTGLEKGKKYFVEATGESGYSEKLSATFEISENEENVFKYLDKNVSEQYILLTVWTENVAGNVRIDIPAGLVPDYTDIAMIDCKNYDEGKYLADDFVDNGSFAKNYSSHTYRFFIDEKSDFDVEQFKVTLNNDNGSYVAEEAVPK
ncbi:MAG: hypothetical protein IJA05_07365 [Oscillospiraceae bacterium]|nr:hypothetical protein [Oscillospiraceae bacterium]